MEKVCAEGLAAVFECSVRTIGNWRAAGMPAEATEKGYRYDVPACVKWYGQRMRPTPEDRARGRLLKAKADKAEHELEELRAELVAWDEIAPFIGAQIERARDELLGSMAGRMVDRIAAEGAGDEKRIRKIMGEEVRRSLTTLSRRAGEDVERYGVAD